MPLLFNGKPLTGYEEQVNHLVPRGKDKEVTFKLLNAEPYRVLGQYGFKYKAGGEKAILAFDTVTLSEYKDEHGKTHKDVTGVLQYYVSNQKVPGRNGIAENLEPKYVVFERHVKRVNTQTQKDLLFFLMKHSENKDSNKWSGKVPKFELVPQGAGHASKVANTNAKLTALNKLAELMENQPSRLRLVYEACGHSDWDIHMPKDSRLEKDKDSILGPLYTIAENDPAKILALINDTDLDIHAKITVALEAKVITYAAGTFSWGEQVKAEPNKRQIVKAPKGKQDDDVARAWFADWLKGEGAVMEEICVELDAIKLAQ
jgi:hypothetical protein